MSRILASFRYSHRGGIRFFRLGNLSITVSVSNRNRNPR